MPILRIPRVISLSLLSLLVLTAPDAGATVGHVTGPRGSATFTASSVSNADVGFEQGRDGSWTGQVGRRTVELAVKPAQIAGEPGAWVSGRGVLLAMVHHHGAWFVKGELLGTPIRITYPDNQALDGWRGLRFDGLAAQPNPPMLPFVLAIWAAVKGASVRSTAYKAVDASPIELGEPAGDDAKLPTPEPKK